MTLLPNKLIYKDYRCLNDAIMMHSNVPYIALETAQICCCLIHLCKWFKPATPCFTIQPNNPPAVCLKVIVFFFYSYRSYRLILMKLFCVISITACLNKHANLSWRYFMKHISTLVILWRSVTDHNSHSFRQVESVISAIMFHLGEKKSLHKTRIRSLTFGCPSVKCIIRTTLTLTHDQRK